MHSEVRPVENNEIFFLSFFSQFSWFEMEKKHVIFTNFIFSF